MRKWLLLVFGYLIFVPPLSAGDDHASATQSLTLTVKPVACLTVTGNPGPMLITDATAGTAELSSSDKTTRYSWTTNLESMKIVASIDARMPDGTALLLNLASGNALSKGTVDVSGALSPVDVVTGIGRGTDANESITYTFTAQASAGNVPDQARTVTLTLTD